MLRLQSLLAPAGLSRAVGWAAAFLIVAPVELLTAAEPAVGLAVGGVTFDRRLDDPPLALAVRFTSAPAAGRIQGPGAVEARWIDCPISPVGRWRCELPAGRLDLRLGAAGMVPHYRWGVEVGAGAETDLGELSLTRGASVAGWVMTAEGEDAGERTSVRLRPATLGVADLPTEEQRLAALDLEAAVGPRGFFQFRGVPPGSYSLVVGHPGFAPRTVAPVEVLAGTESTLRETVVLERPLEVEIAIEPPLDPWGRPWQLELVRQRDGHRDLVPAFAGDTGPEGRVAASGLEPGTHQAVLSDADGARWLIEELEVVADGAVVLTVPVVEIEGRVTAGGEPLPAQLVFGGLYGPRQVLFYSDLDGEFAGFLPSEGEWAVELYAEEGEESASVGPVEVARLPGRRAARVDLELPGGRVEGTVVDADGRTVAGARLLLASLHRREIAGRRTADADGRFAIRWLRPGGYFAYAETAEAKSDWVAVEVEDDRGAELRLVVRPQVELAGVLSSTWGPVPGALVRAVPDWAGVPGEVAQGQSGADGGFRLSLPRGTGGASLAVLAPGHPLALRRVTVGRVPPPVQIALAAEPGRVVVEASGSGSDRTAELGLAYLSHGGAAVPLSVLGEWVTPAAPEGDGAAALVLSTVEPGEWAVCSPRALLAGGEAASSCRSGYLPAGGELRLRLPPSSAAATSNEVEGEP